jgi:hypothetical protein
VPIGTAGPQRLGSWRSVAGRRQARAGDVVRRDPAAAAPGELLEAVLQRMRERRAARRSRCPRGMAGSSGSSRSRTSGPAGRTRLKKQCRRRRSRNVMPPRRRKMNEMDHCENVHVDRVACPWLIRKFVDPKAEFSSSPPTRSRLLRSGGRDPVRREGVELGHHGKGMSVRRDRQEAQGFRRRAPCRSPGS